MGRLYSHNNWYKKMGQVKNPLPTATISASPQQREIAAAMAIDGKMDTPYGANIHRCLNLCHS
jgi:hypothetical protein